MYPRSRPLPPGMLSALRALARGDRDTFYRADAHTVAALVRRGLVELRISASGQGVGAKRHALTDAGLAFAQAMGWVARDPARTRGGLAHRLGKTPSDFAPRALARGTRAEMREHGLSRRVAQQIAMDHLSEDPRYYSRHLKKGARRG
jgi:hypothetical protein